MIINEMRYFMWRFRVFHSCYFIPSSFLFNVDFQIGLHNILDSHGSFVKFLISNQTVFLIFRNLNTHLLIYHFCKRILSEHHVTTTKNSKPIRTTLLCCLYFLNLAGDRSMIVCPDSLEELQILLSLVRD